MFKTSPGPWARDKYGTLKDRNGRDVCFRSISITCAGPGVEQAEANTDLIAYAPALLDALENLQGAMIASSEYDGTVFDFCTDCGANDLSGDRVLKHRDSCGWMAAIKVIQAATGEASS